MLSGRVSAVALRPAAAQERDRADIESGQRGMNACSSPGYTTSRLSTPASRSSRWVVRDHRSGQVSSLVPWWISTGSVIRSK